LADFDYETTMRAVFDAVNEADDVSGGISRLIEFCRGEAPEDAALWDDLAERDFAADYVQFRDDFGDSLKGSPIPPKYTGFYFGLDGLNMPNGKGIELGCSDTFDNSKDDGDVSWAYDGSHYPFEIASPMLSELYDGVVEIASLADHAVCIGYVGLAVRDALRELPISDTLGKARARAICWGPHDGDLYRLGTLRPDGLVLECKWRW
jgi:hypothetical protein